MIAVQMNWAHVAKVLGAGMYISVQNGKTVTFIIHNNKAGLQTWSTSTGTGLPVRTLLRPSRAEKVAS